MDKQKILDGLADSKPWSILTELDYNDLSEVCRWALLGAAVEQIVLNTLTKGEAIKDMHPAMRSKFVASCDLDLETASYALDAIFRVVVN